MLCCVETAILLDMTFFLWKWLSVKGVASVMSSANWQANKHLSSAVISGLHWMSGPSLQLASAKLIKGWSKTYHSYVSSNLHSTQKILYLETIKILKSLSCQDVTHKGKGCCLKSVSSCLTRLPFQNLDWCAGTPREKTGMGSSVQVIFYVAFSH